MGWLIWPVAYVGDAYTYELNQADKARYAEAVVTSYAATGIADPAWFSGWYTDEIQQAMEQVAQANPGKANWARALANQASVSVARPVQVKAQAQVSEAIPAWLIWPALVAALLGLGGGVWLLRRSRVVSTLPGPAEFDRAFTPRYVELGKSSFVPLRQASPSLAQAQLTFGPDQPCDQHFPIERDGAHLGEFGVSQVEDEPAWDVWLFDQKALVTVTKVLANQASEELAGRGEVIGLNSPVVLDTPGLRMAGKAVQFGKGIKVELSVEGKE